MPAPIILVDGLEPPPVGAKVNGRKSAAQSILLSLKKTTGVESILWSVDCTPGSSATIDDNEPGFPFSTTMTLNGYGTYRIIATANGDSASSETLATVYVPTLNKQIRIPIPLEETEYDTQYQIHDSIADAAAAIDEPGSSIEGMTIGDFGISAGSTNAGYVLMALLGNHPKALCVQPANAPVAPDFVWAFSSGSHRDFWRFNTDTLELTKFTLERDFGSAANTSYQGAAYGAGFLWVSDVDSSKLLCIDATSGNLVAEITTDAVGRSVVFDEDTNTVTTVNAAGSYAVIDAIDRTILRTAPFPSVINAGCCISSGRVWFPGLHYVYGLVPTTGDIASVDAGGAHHMVGLALDSTSGKIFTWNSTSGILKRFDPSTYLFEAGGNLAIAGFTFFALGCDPTVGQVRLVGYHVVDTKDRLTVLTITNLAANPPTNSAHVDYKELEASSYNERFGHLVYAGLGVGWPGSYFTFTESDSFQFQQSPVGYANEFSLVSTLGFHASSVVGQNNRGMVGEVTTDEGDLATADPVSGGSRGGAAMVFVNGLSRNVGDGTNSGVECYFSGDNGLNARYLAEVIDGDFLYWNGGVAGFQLDATYKLDFVFMQ